MTAALVHRDVYSHTYPSRDTHLRVNEKKIYYKYDTDLFCVSRTCEAHRLLDRTRASGTGGVRDAPRFVEKRTPAPAGHRKSEPRWISPVLKKKRFCKKQPPVFSRRGCPHPINPPLVNSVSRSVHFAAERRIVLCPRCVCTAFIGPSRIARLRPEAIRPQFFGVR